METNDWHLTVERESESDQQLAPTSGLGVLHRIKTRIFILHKFSVLHFIVAQLGRRLLCCHLDANFDCALAPLDDLCFREFSVELYLHVVTLKGRDWLLVHGRVILQVVPNVLNQFPFSFVLCHAV